MPTARPGRGISMFGRRSHRDGSDASGSARSAWLRWVAWSLVAAFAVAVVIKAFVAEPYEVSSLSMQPGLEVGDRVLVDKATSADPSRGDIVVFDGTNSFVGGEPRGALSSLLALVGLGGDGATFVKRVIGVGGDRVTCCTRAGRLALNGREISEPYIYAGDAPSDFAFDVIVPKGHLWVMGDHRSESADSRALMGRPGGGFVPATRVLGKAEWIVWPPSRAGRVPSTEAFSGVVAP